MKAKKLLSLLTAAALSMSLTAPAFATEKTDSLSGYTDLASDGWYLEAVRYAVENGLMVGKAEGIFAPDEDVTRAAVYQTMYSKEGKPAVDAPASFSDVEGKWYADSAAWAQAAGLSAGDGNGMYAGDRAITYGELDTILEAYAEYKGLSTKGLEKSGKDANATAIRADLAAMLQKIAGLKKYYFDAENPYDGVMSGLYNVAVTVGEETHYATYYLSEGLQPWTPATIVLTPDNTTAADFAESETGLAWRAVADENKIGLAFFAPANGGSWNLNMAEDGRDEGEFLSQLYMNMRSKSVKHAAAFSMDKSHATLVGYGEGGAAALLFGAEYATEFSGICAVDATAVPADALNTVGEQLVYPFPADSTAGVEEMSIQAKTVDTPVLFVNSAETNPEALAYYIAANDAKEVETGKYQAAESDAIVWVTDEAKTPAVLYKEFLGTTKRFMAMQEGGRVSFAKDFTEPGFTIHEEEVNGELRRWITYVPSTYTGDKEVPLVVVMHGYTASMYAIAEESRWYDVAEENGFIVLFMQALVRPADAMGNIPASVWVAGAFSALFPNMDPKVDVNFINAVIDQTEAKYNIDSSRIYATGHSNGSMMTFTMGENATDRFAAIAPVGYVSAPTNGFSSDAMLPTWVMVGEFDSAATPVLEEGKTNVQTLSAWNEHNGVDETTATDSESYDGQWKTKTFTNEEGVPMVKFTNVLGTPHVYMAEQSVSIWEEFFSKYSRGEDGTLYYDGVAVETNAYVNSNGWYTHSVG